MDRRGVQVPVALIKVAGAELPHAYGGLRLEEPQNVRH
jgi:hypothetical protein